MDQKPRVLQICHDYKDLTSVKEEPSREKSDSPLTNRVGFIKSSNNNKDSSSQMDFDLKNWNKKFNTIVTFPNVS